MLREEWVAVDKRLPSTVSGIYMVKLEDGQQKKCYYHQDKMSWLHFYDKMTKFSHWQDFETREFLQNVEFWLEKKQ